MQNFSRGERLSKKKIINRLFTEGNSFVVHPFRIWWLKLPEASASELPVQLLISVAKRNIPSAVTRNLIKRRMREAYRKNKSLLHVVSDDSKYALALVYVDRKPLKYDEIEKKIIFVLQRLFVKNEKSFG